MNISADPPSTRRNHALEGHVALVTGAGAGIGAETSVLLAEAGAEVVLLSLEIEQLKNVANRITAIGGKAHIIACDITDTLRLRSAIAKLDRLDVLVNNAGINIPEPFLDVSDIHLDQMLALDVRAAFVVAQESVRKMLEASDRRERGGAVINVSSQMGHVGSERRSVYCMCKHAVEGLTKAMAVELGPNNIRVNSVAPTFLETPMTSTFFADTKFRDWVVSRIPLGRIGKPQEVAAAIVFLASSDASLITGASLLIDGGWTAQ